MNYNYYNSSINRLSTESKCYSKKKIMNVLSESKLKSDIKNQIIKRDKLVDNYNNRIKNFANEMIYRPIKVNNYKNNETTTRAKYYNENLDKIIGKQGFTFSQFITDKERLEKLKKEKIDKEKLLFNKNKYQQNENNLDNENLSKKKKYKSDLTIDELALLDLIVQPQFRFKHRTEVERIVDTLSNNNILSTNQRKLIDRKLYPEASININKNNNLSKRNKLLTKNKLKPQIINYDYINNELNKLTEIKSKEAKIKYPDYIYSYKDYLNKIKENSDVNYNTQKNNNNNNYASHNVLTLSAKRRKFNIKSSIQLLGEINNEAKKLLKNLNTKTYFKGTSSIPYNKYINCNNDNKNINSIFNSFHVGKKLKSAFKNFSDNSIKKDKNNLLNNKNYIKTYNDDVFFPVSQNDFYSNSNTYNNEASLNYKDEDEANEFKLNYNPLLKFEENIVDYNKLRNVRRLFVNSQKNDNNLGNTNITNNILFTPNNINEEKQIKQAAYKNLIKRLVKNKLKKNISVYHTKLLDSKDELNKDDDKVIIGSESVHKEDLQKIALRVLHKCGYYTTKNNNNKNSHCVREGKTCITNGKTIKEFEKDKGLDFIYRNLKWDT